MAESVTSLTSGTQLGGYRIIRPLTDSSFLAEASAGRRVVLKLLESDCLLRRQLHPLIKDRLGRVQELAVLSLATLHTVERDEQSAYMVWEYLEGQTLEEWTVSGNHTADEFLVLARELIDTVESLHGHGIVHGAIHGRNVIMDARGMPRLTHISPLLYDDPADDAQDVIHTLSEASVGAGGASSAVLNDAIERKLSLRELGAQIMIGSQGATPEDHVEEEQEDRRVRRRAFVAALAAIVAGVAVALVMWWMAHRMTVTPSRDFRPANASPLRTISDGAKS